MAMARSALARVAHGRHHVSQTLLPARAGPKLSLRRHPAAGHIGKRYLSDGKGQWFYSALDKLPDVTEYVPLSSIITLCAFTYGMATMIPYTIANTKRGRFDEEITVDNEVDNEDIYVSISERLNEL